MNIVCKVLLSLWSDRHVENVKVGTYVEACKEWHSGINVLFLDYIIRHQHHHQHK